MSQDYKEGSLTFSFPDEWLVCRPEESSYYAGQFQKFCDGCKEMDFLAYDPHTHTLWLIEVKDYRVNERIKQQHLADEVAHKTRDVLAMLPAAKVRDHTLSEKGKLQIGDFSRRTRNLSELRVVLHCELPAKPSKLYPVIKDAANLSTQLRQKLRSVDPHAFFTNRQQGQALDWNVT